MSRCADRMDTRHISAVMSDGSHLAFRRTPLSTGELPAPRRVSSVRLMVTTTVDIECVARVSPPPFSTDDVTLAAPLVVPPAAAGLRLVPILTIVAMVGAGALIWASRSAASPIRWH